VQLATCVQSAQCSSSSSSLTALVPGRPFYVAEFQAVVRHAFTRGAAVAVAPDDLSSAEQRGQHHRPQSRGMRERLIIRYINNSAADLPPPQPPGPWAERVELEQDTCIHRSTGRSQSRRIGPRRARRRRPSEAGGRHDVAAVRAQAGARMLLVCDVHTADIRLRTDDVGGVGGHQHWPGERRQQLDRYVCIIRHLRAGVMVVWLADGGAAAKQAPDRPSSASSSTPCSTGRTRRPSSPAPARRQTTMATACCPPRRATRRRPRPSPLRATASSASAKSARPASPTAPTTARHAGGAS